MRKVLFGAIVPAALVAAVVTFGFWRVETPRPAPVAVVEPCEWQQMQVECGTVRVPENHADPDGPTIELFLVIARATGQPTDDPVFYFSGGPGTASSGSLRLAQAHAELRRTRDFVFLDQRGTGRSHPLACESPDTPVRHLGPYFVRDEVVACRAALESRADLRRYTTADAARDLDLVRRALGYERLNVMGTSYGTRMAWTYAAMFPEHARTLLLVGPVPPGFRVPLPFSHGFDVALEGLLAVCEADAACRAAYPSLRADTDRAFDRLRAGPVPVRVSALPSAGAEAFMTYGEFAEAVRYMLYAAERARMLPSLLTRAAAGDYSPIANFAVANRRNLSRAIAMGMYLSVTCAEDLPFIDADTLREATDGTRLGDYRVAQQQAACDEWVRGDGPDPSTTVPIQTSALLEVGVFDPASPPADARAAMPLLPNGRLIEVPHAGHATGGVGIDDCLMDLERTFIEHGHARDLDVSCVQSARRPSFQ